MSHIAAAAVAALTSTLTPEQFALWLAEHEPAAVVGITLYPLDCPVARFLRKRTALTFTVTDIAIGDEHGCPILDADALPAWVGEFIRTVDGWGTLQAAFADRPYRSVPVPAGLALARLRRVVPSLAQEHATGPERSAG